MPCCFSAFTHANALAWFGTVLACTAAAQVAALAIEQRDDVVQLSSRQLIRTTSPYVSNAAVNSDGEDATVPNGFELQDVFFAPTYEQALDVYAGRQGMDEMLDVYRAKWQLACVVQLVMSSSTFRMNKTFGWFHFTRSATKDGHPTAGSAVGSAVFTYQAGCYETSTYDATGAKPGKPVRNHTSTVKRAFGWTAEQAKEDGQALADQLNQLKGSG